MLVLTCGIGERIFVGEYPIMVTRVRGRRATLAVDAPDDVPVDREKIRNRKRGVTRTIPRASLRPEQR